MSLRLRLALLLGAVILLTAFGLVLAGRKGVVDPLAREVMHELVGQALDVARRVEQGADPEELGRSLGLEVRLEPEAPPGRRRGAERRGWRPRMTPGGRIWIRPGPGGSAIAVPTSRGWVVVARKLDLERPGHRLLLAGLVIAVVSLAFAWVLAHLATRPVRVTTAAMRRMAQGELSHRLDDRTGPPELREAARAFNAMAERVQRLLRTERELLAGVSHELRTPLTRMRLALELLKEGADAQPLLESMETDLDEADRAISAMLQVSRLELGGSVRCRPVDPEPIVRSALAKVEMGDRQVEVQGRASPVMADPAALERILLNLLRNVARHTPAGTRATVRLDGATITVLDTGPGVPEPDLEALFEPFERRGSRDGGLGLGLVLARRLAELQGGTLTAANRPEGGLAFTLRLRAAARSPRPGEAAPADPSPGA